MTGPSADLVSDLCEELERLEAELAKVVIENGVLRQLAARAEACPHQAVEPAAPRSVEEATLQAQEYARDIGSPLIFTKRAFKEARRSQFGRPTEVLRLLRDLADASLQWRQGTLSSWRSHFGGEYRADVSQTAHTRYASEYTVFHDGRSYVLGPHFRLGTGAPATVLRIYWSVDPSSRTVVVGHVGRKLKDKSNP